MARHLLQINPHPQISPTQSFFQYIYCMLFEVFFNQSSDPPTATCYSMGFQEILRSSTRKVNMFEVLKYIAYILGKIATRRTAECKRLCHIAFALLKTSTRSETYQNYAQKNNSTLEISCCHSHCSVGDKIFTFWCRLWKPARHALYRLETISKLRCSKWWRGIQHTNSPILHVTRDVGRQT